VIEPLETSVEGIPSDTARGSDPSVFVLPADPGSSTADMYRRFSGSPSSCRAREGVVAIVSTGVLNSPDRFSATGGRRDVTNFEMDLDIRRFEGSIRANDPWIALARMELGSLEPGSYRLIVRETVRRFTDLAHPEAATDPTKTERSFAFACVQ
jgi:hypothetical protein